MTAEWTENGRLSAGGKDLEYACYGPSPDKAPTLVLLHEGLGCTALWREFPKALAEAGTISPEDLDLIRYVESAAEAVALAAALAMCSAAKGTAAAPVTAPHMAAHYRSNTPAPSQCLALIPLTNGLSPNLLISPAPAPTPRKARLPA